MIYYGKDNGYNLQHWKYISKHKSKNGKWVYVYKTKKERDAEENEKSAKELEEKVIKARKEFEENAKKINSKKKELDELQKEYEKKVKTFDKLYKDGTENGSYTTHDGRFVDSRSGSRHLNQALSLANHGTLRKLLNKKDNLEAEITRLEIENGVIKDKIKNPKKEKPKQTPGQKIYYFDGTKWVEKKKT